MKLVLVEWDDSHEIYGWVKIKHLENSCEQLTCKSVGWLIKETKTHIMIAAHLAATNMPDGPYDGCGNMCIPKKVIIKTTVLRKGK